MLPSDQENFLARTLHPTNYGRFCPIETPEGTEIGLRKNLAILSKVSTGLWLDEDKFLKELEDLGLDKEGVEGSDVVPNHFIENAIPADFDGIVIIGGGGMHDTLTNDTTTTQQIVAQVKAFSEARKLVSAICIGPIALAKAGVITGKRITGWDDGNNTQKTEIESAGATFTAEPVTVDGNLITANGPSAATAFGEAIKNYFSKEETSNAEEKN